MGRTPFDESTLRLLRLNALNKVYAGTDESLTDETVWGVKLTDSLMNEGEHTGHPSKHPMKKRDLAFTTRHAFSGPRHVSVTLTVTYPFGD